MSTIPIFIRIIIVRIFTRGTMKKNTDKQLPDRLRDRGVFRKLPNMNKPDADADYDPDADYVESEYEGVVSRRQAYDPDVARINAEYAKAMKEAAAKAHDLFLAVHPEASGLRFHRSKTYVSKPRPAGFSEVPIAIIRRMLQPGWVGKTQKAILEAVQEEMPQYAIASAKNIWTMEHMGWQLENLRDAVASGPAAFRTADVSKCRTLSDFRRDLKLHAAGTPDSYRATIRITPDTVTINKLVVNITMNTVRGKAIPTARINVEKLLEALKKPRG